MGGINVRLMALEVEIFADLFQNRDLSITCMLISYFLIADILNKRVKMARIECDYDVLFEEDLIRTRVLDLGSEITRDYKGRDLVIVGILKGSVVFLSDLIRGIDLPLSIDFISVSSYGCNMESSGVVKMLNDLTNPVEGRDILLVEDIIDTGLTISYIIENIKIKNPNSIKICSFLDKKDARNVDISLDITYVGFEVPNRFLVGYGLDYNEQYRNLPFIAALCE